MIHHEIAKSTAPSTRRKGRCFVLVMLLVALLSGPASAAMQERVETLVLQIFPMTHQPAREALPLVDSFLSPAGTVSWQQEDNALVIKDRPSVLAKLTPVLAEFDHPSQVLILEIYLLRASRSPFGGAASDGSATESALPPELASQLGSILQLNHYQGLGSVRLSTHEGATVVGGLGTQYEVNFDAGTVLRGRFLKLADFKVERLRRGEREAIFHSNVNLKLGRPAFITVSRDAGSASGLVVALLWRPKGGSGVSPVLPGDGH